MSNANEAREFALQLDAEFAEMIEEAHEFVALVGLYALRGVVNKSPVDTGRFKANWQLSIGTPLTGTLDEFDINGGVTIQKGQTSAMAYAALEGYPPIWITNNLPYAEPLEDGSSMQAPGGMMGLTVAEIQAQFDGKVI